MFYAKQSTAKTCIVGPILDSAGAEYASAVIGDLSISKNGGTLTAMASAATLTYIANGMYTLVMTTGNLDTLGTAEISCNKAGYQMRQKEFQVLPATVYDALVTNATTVAGGLGDIQRMAGTALTARDIGASVLLSSGTGTGQISLTSGTVDVGKWLGTACSTPTTAGVPEVDLILFLGAAPTAGSIPTVAEIADGVWDEDATAHQTQGTFGQAIGDPVADTNSLFKAVVTDATGATVGIDTAAILADTNELQTDWVNGGRLDIILDARASQSSVDQIDAEIEVLDTVADATYALVGTVQTAVGALPDYADVQTAVDDGVTANVLINRGLQRLGFLMAQEIGVCADAGTAAESYTITINSTTYTIDHVGLDSTGNRGTAVLSET